MMEASTRPIRPVLLNGGKRLCEWIEAGGAPARPVGLRGFRQRWSTFWFERYFAMTAGKCASIPLPPDPTFIVGLWRTGSTLLHSLLTEASRRTTPRTWQCFRPADFLLAPPPRQLQVGRPMDKGTIDTFSPQEDEFAALLLGEPSVYRAFIDPRRVGELTPLLGGWRDADSVVAPLSNRWETFLKAIVLQSPGPLLLKSPNHTFRLPWLARRFPRARFIWLTRPASDVLASNRRMWTAMIDRYGQWPQDSAALEAFIHSAMRQHDDILDWARVSLAGRLHVVTFRDVTQNGTSLASRLVDALESGDLP